MEPVLSSALTILAIITGAVLIIHGIIAVVDALVRWGKHATYQS